MKKIKSFTCLEVLAICNFINQLTEEKDEKLGLKLRWTIKKGFDKLQPIAKRYEDFRQEYVTKLQNEWFNEEKSEEFMQTVVDNEGNPILDAEGNEQTQPARKIKEEFMKDYQVAVDELNQKLQEIAEEQNEVEMDVFDIDSFVENLNDDGVLTFDDLIMLQAFDDHTNVVDNNENKEAE